jgi:hypothetical protein
VLFADEHVVTVKAAPVAAPAAASNADEGSGL